MSLRLIQLGLSAALCCSPVMAADEPTISVVGPEELFLAHEDMNCRGLARGSGRDSADMPVTAFRRGDGSVIMMAGNKNNFYLEGPSVDEAVRASCQPLLEPVDDPDPASFRNLQWVFAVYAKSYEFVLAFIHNEYHGWDFETWGDDCDVSSHRNRECWYGSTALAVSADGGFTFESPPPPDNVLATLPFRFTPGARRAGVNSPKVVGNPRDGMLYVLVSHFNVGRDIGPEQCLLRGSGEALNDWRAWDGVGFNLDMESPYAIERADVDCAPVLPYIANSVKFIPSLDLFVSTGLFRREVVYAFSKDLITWSEPETLMKVVPHQVWEPGMPPPRAYFSLLDPTSPSINFDTLEAEPYLYFVQLRIVDDEIYPAKSDIYRVPLFIHRFSREPPG